MRIGLHDSDATNFPNLALMKLSAWHKAQGDFVEWYDPWNGLTEEYDKVYVSKVFSFSKDFSCIYSAFKRDYDIDLLRIPYMHWWEFKMLFDGLAEDNEIKKRIMYRGVDIGTIKDPDERKRIVKIQASIALEENQLTDYDIGDVFW